MWFCSGLNVGEGLQVNLASSKEDSPDSRESPRFAFSPEEPLPKTVSEHQVVHPMKIDYRRGEPKSKARNISALRAKHTETCAFADN